MTESPRPPGCDGRRLRFEHAMRDDESAPGAVLAALGPQWLDDSRPVLEAAGLDGRRPGTLALLSEDEARRLAWTMRCDPAALIARTGRSAKAKAPVLFDGTALPRIRLETRVRRIAPGSLSDSPHHRAAWMDRLLPYCPASLERLVDACAACGSALVWTGVGRLDLCGSCGDAIAPSSAAPLPEALADGYREFAALSSPIRAVRRPVIDNLHHELQAVCPGSLTRMAFQLGATLAGGTAAITSPKAWGSVPPDELAAACSAGQAMLRDWPDALHEAYQRAARGIVDDQAAFDRVRARLKSMVGDDQPADTSRLLVQALPDLRRHAAHGFAGLRPHLIARTATNRLGIKPIELPALRRWPGLLFRSVPGRSRVIGQYDAGQIDEIADALHGADSIRKAAWSFGLPVHGAEQLADMDLLLHERHGAVLALGRVDHVTDRSVDDLRSRLTAIVRRDEPPRGAEPLRSAACVLGGAPKPWGAIVAALLDGGLWAWGDLESDALHVPALLVDPVQAEEALLALAGRFPPRGSIGRADDVSIQDASEMLNVLPRRLEAVAKAYDVRFVRVGKRLAASLDEISLMAASFVSLVELRRRTGGTIAYARRLAAEAGAEPLPSGFERAPLALAGILPAVPVARGRRAAVALRRASAAPAAVGASA